MSFLITGKTACMMYSTKNVYYLSATRKKKKRVPVVFQPQRPYKCGSVGGGDKYITMQNINQSIIKVEYAVRGPLVARALEIEKELKSGTTKPFKTVIRANLGDAHAMGQKPVTFIRQVTACCAYPEIMNCANFPGDVKARAKSILAACGGGSVGSYSASPGIELIRKDIAKFIETRDGHPCKWANITIGGGASNVIKYCLEMFANNPGGKPSGVMIPIPQYPLYSASITMLGLTQAPYYLDEDNKWALSTEELDRAYKEASQHSQVRALVVINPGNPTGQVLALKNIEDIIKFAHEHKLFIFADEVYQENIYAEGSQFHSFKKVLFDMGSPYNKMEMASYMSVSKGYSGECGLRGGWMEMINMDPQVEANFQKAISANLCSTVLGQVVVDCVANPPKQGEESFDLWCQEKTNILNTLKERSIIVYESFNKMKGFKCNPVQGAMYAFPRFELSPAVLEAAKKDGKKPDTFYAFQLLEATGICVVAGSGFGQKPGTHHFRTTILAQTPILKEMLNTFSKFHEDFSKKFT